MIYYYSRVSTASQNSARQILNFKNHSDFKSENLFIDKVQGNVPFMERPEASKLFEAVTSMEGRHTICVDSIDRLGRNLIDILNTIERFTKNGISLKSQKEGFETLLENGKENQMAKIVVACMGSIAELERNRLKVRQLEGISIAKASGKYSGRKFGSIQTDTKLLERHAIIVKKLNKGLTVRDVAAMLNCSTTTVMKVKKVLEKREQRS